MLQTKTTGSFVKATFIVLLAACLCLAGLFFINSFGSFDLALFAENPLLLPALLLQVCATFLFILAWKILLAMRPDSGFSFAECTSHIGVTLMGKYLPGKVWGLMGRSYLLSRRGFGNSEAVSLLIADQYLTFYSGIALGVIGLAAYVSWQLGLATVVMIVLTAPVLIRFYGGIVHWLMGKSRLFLKRLAEDIEPQAVAIKQGLFGLSLLIYTIHWLATALVLCLLFYPMIDAAPLANMALIVAAIPLAVLSGFVAMWAPGGIGVREGVIVMILALNLPLDIAASIAITYRLICVINDLGTGSFALFYFLRNAPAVLQE